MMSGRRVSGLLLAAGFALSSIWLRHPSELPEAVRPITGFPEQVGAWSGTDRALSERQFELLETREVLLRDWRRGDDREGERVILCVSVAGENRKAAHPPHVCYRGQGWKVRERRELARIFAGRERRFEELQIHRDGRRQLVWSWYRVGEHETASYLKQQWLGVLAEVKRTPTPSALLRFSTPMESGEPDAARRRLTEFLDDVLPSLETALNRRNEAE